MACACVPPGVPLCGKLLAALVMVGVQNKLLFVSSFGALSTLLYAAPTAPLPFASHCAPASHLICSCLWPHRAPLTYTGQRGRFAPLSCWCSCSRCAMASTTACCAPSPPQPGQGERRRRKVAGAVFISRTLLPQQSRAAQQDITPPRRWRAATTLSPPPHDAAQANALRPQHRQHAAPSRVC